MPSLKYLMRSIRRITHDHPQPNIFRTSRITALQPHCIARSIERTPLSQVRCVSKYMQVRLIQSSVTLHDEQTVNVPPFAESVSEGDVRWDKKVGDGIAVDEVVCSVETDKAVVPVTSPVSGVITAQLVKDRATVKPGMPLFKVKKGPPPAGKPKPAAAPGPPAAKPGAPAPPPPPAKAPPPPAAKPPPPAAKPPPPAAKPPPSAAKPPAPPPPAAKPPAPAPTAAAKAKPPPSTPAAPPPPRPVAGTRTEHREAMSRMRLRIAERLKGAQDTAAMLTTFNEVDMSNVIAFRKRYMKEFQRKFKLKLSFMAPFIRACVFALQDQPVVNAYLQGKDVVFHDFVDISVAVATPRGLAVPVLRNCEAMTLADIDLALKAMADKARAGRLAVEDMDGGTFTVSNGGVFGSLLSTPIINPPQSAILGMHATFDRPVAMGKKVVVRPMMYIALTYDHRIIDGREAVFFLKKVKMAVEDPGIIFLGI